MRIEPSSFDAGARRWGTTRWRLTPRIRFGALLGVVAAVAAGAIVASGRPWLRVFIAPAWNTGARVSGSTQSPTPAIIIGVSFVLGFALGFLGWAATRTRSRPESEQRRMVALNLVALCVAAAIELLMYPTIASGLIEAVGLSGAMGGEYPLVLAGRLLPGALLCLVLATISAYWTLRRGPHKIAAVMLSIWLLQSFALLASIAWYFSPSGPTSSLSFRSRQ